MGMGHVSSFPTSYINIFRRLPILEEGALSLLTSDLCLFLLPRVLLETKVLLVLLALLALE